ncbi:MAG: S8 family serine peptidase, partial [Acidimicrobiia bacterium]
LDTGAQLDHPVLSDSFTSASYDFIDDDPVPSDDSNGLDDDGDGAVDEAVGHGTYVAGLVHLVAPEAQIMPLRVLDTDGNGDTFVIAEALWFAVAHGAQVVNLSLGLVQDSEFLEEVIEDVVEEGVTVVASAGNVDSDLPLYPAAFDDVLAVGAIGPTDVKSPFSNYGLWVDLVAPGESVYSTYPTDGWAWWGGTSMAAPFVTGQAALLYSLDGELDREAVALVIISTAVSVAASNPDHIGLLGAGRPDLVASLVAALEGDELDEGGAG